MTGWVRAAEQIDKALDEINRIDSEPTWEGLRTDASPGRFLVALLLIALAIVLINGFARRRQRRRIEAEAARPSPHPPPAARAAPAAAGPGSDTDAILQAADAVRPAPAAEAFPAVHAAHAGGIGDGAARPAIPPPPPPAAPPPESTRALRPGDRIEIRFPGGRGHWEAALLANLDASFAIAYPDEPARQGKPARTGELVTGHLPNTHPARLFISGIAAPPTPPPPGNDRSWVWIRHADIVCDDE